MRRIGVTEWQVRLGELRQGAEPVLVMYRQRPTAILVPVPPAYWPDANPFLSRIMKIRDQYLHSPAGQDTHPWVKDTYLPKKVNVVEARRNSAMVFAHLTYNEPVILTFYDYDSIVMLPLPSDFADQMTASLGEQILEEMRASGTAV